MGDVSNRETKYATVVTHCLGPSSDSQGPTVVPLRKATQDFKSNFGKFPGKNQGWDFVQASGMTSVAREFPTYRFSHSLTPLERKCFQSAMPPEHHWDLSANFL